jgi:hypothetical protein
VSIAKVGAQSDVGEFGRGQLRLPMVLDSANMASPVVLIFHRQATADDGPLVRLLAHARSELSVRQARFFKEAGAAEVRIDYRSAASFGDLLSLAAPRSGGVIVLGSGAVPRLNRTDADLLVATASSGKPVALTNNRYSSDVCAIGDVRVLRDLPALPADNALPRWLEERAGVAVDQLPGRERLGLDIDSPLDIALWALASDAPHWVRTLATREGLAVPRRDELRKLATDPRGELLVFGRAASTTLRWLERNVRCRVRFLAEERGLRASSPLAIGATSPTGKARSPRATLGWLLDARGPDALADVVGELADGAILDTRVLMADRYGADEAAWPSPADRFASDLLRPDEVDEPWLRALTQAAATSSLPMALGAHSLVGPGIRLVLGTRD